MVELNEPGVIGGFVVGGLVLLLCLLPCTIIFCCYYCAPRRFFKLATWRAARQAKVTEKFVDAGGFRWCYYEGGIKNKDRPSMLYLHGFSADKGYTLGLIRHFTPHFHVIAPDLVGHGQTRPISASVIESDLSYQIPDQVERLHALVQALSLDRQPFNIGGISMGGFIAGVYASRYPAEIRSLALHCPAGIDGPTPSPFIKAITTFEEKLGVDGGITATKNWLLPKSPEDVQRLTSRIFYQQPWVPYRYYVAVHQDKMERKDILCKVVEDMLTPPYHILLQDSLPSLHMPVLVAWGENDEILDVSCIEVIKQRVPGPKTIKTFPRTGHAMIVESAEPVAMFHRDWLFSLEHNIPTETTSLLSGHDGRSTSHDTSSATSSLSSSSSSSSSTAKSVSIAPLVAATTVPAEK